MVATIEEVNKQILFGSCGCIQEIKLNIEWQMAGLLKKINVDFMDRIVLLAALYWVKNFQLCNKY